MSVSSRAAHTHGKRTWTDTEVLDNIERLAISLAKDNDSYDDDYIEGKANAYRRIANTIQYWRNERNTIPARQEVKQRVDTETDLLN